MWNILKQIVTRNKQIHWNSIYTNIFRMSAGDMLKRLESRATNAEQIINSLKNEIAEIRKVATQQSEQSKVQLLESENEELRKEIEHFKTKLIYLEVANGIKQIPVPSAGVVNSKLPVQVKAENIHERPTVPSDNDKTDIDVQRMDKKKKDKASNKKAKSGGEKENEVDEPPIDVGRLDLRVGCITVAKKHPDADTLYIEEVDVGELKQRTVVSGLVKYVPIEEMQNRLVVLLCNLKPAKMRGVTSEAMVMCASSPDKVEILVPPPGSMPGDEVHIEGYPRVPDAVLNPKKKVFETVAPDLKTNFERVATYKGAAFTVPGKGVVTSPTLVGVNVK